MDGSGQSVAGDLGPSERMQMAAGARQLERPPGVHPREAQDRRPVDHRSACGEAVLELTLDMTYQQLEALEKAASIQGLTTGHLLRRLIRICLARMDGSLPPEGPAVPDAEADGRRATPE